MTRPDVYYRPAWGTWWQPDDVRESDQAPGLIMEQTQPQALSWASLQAMPPRTTTGYCSTDQGVRSGGRFHRRLFYVDERDG